MSEESGEEKRESWSTYFLNLAMLTAARATCTRAKVGAVLTREHRILTTGYNGSPSGWSHCTEDGCLLIDGRCKRCVHAERNAINWAAHEGISTKNSRIYTTLPPCITCFLDCVTAGVTSFVWPTNAVARNQEEMSLIRGWAATHNIELRSAYLEDTV